MCRHILKLASFVVVLGLVVPSASAQVRLFTLGGDAGTGYDPILNELDLATGQVIRSVVITLAGKTVEHGTAIATHPATHELYAVLSIADQTGRELVTIDPVTGVATSIGNTGLNITSIDFSPYGTLWATVGPSPPDAALCVLGTSDAIPMILIGLNGEGGHSMAYEPVKNVIIHLGGRDEFRFMEEIDPNLLTSTPVPLSGYEYQRMVGLTFLDGGLLLGAASQSDSLVRLTTEGVASLDVESNSQLTALTFYPPVFLFGDGFESGDTFEW